MQQPTFYFLSNFGEDRSVSGLLAQTPPNSTLARELLRPCFVLRLIAMSLAQRLFQAAALHWAIAADRSVPERNCRGQSFFAVRTAEASGRGLE